MLSGGEENARILCSPSITGSPTIDKRACLIFRHITINSSSSGNDLIDPLSLEVDLIDPLSDDFGRFEDFSSSSSGAMDQVCFRSNEKYHLVLDGDSGVPETDSAGVPSDGSLASGAVSAGSLANGVLELDSAGGVSDGSLTSGALELVLLGVYPMVRSSLVRWS